MTVGGTVVLVGVTGFSGYDWVGLVLVGVTGWDCGFSGCDCGFSGWDWF